jgi:hypothetical protein
VTLIDLRYDSLRTVDPIISTFCWSGNFILCKDKEFKAAIEASSYAKYYLDSKKRKTIQGVLVVCEYAYYIERYCGQEKSQAENTSLIALYAHCIDRTICIYTHYM